MQIFPHFWNISSQIYVKQKCEEYISLFLSIQSPQSVPVSLSLPSSLSLSQKEKTEYINDIRLNFKDDKVISLERMKFYMLQIFK